VATITEIRVSYQTTANLGNYSNIKPALDLTAVLEPGEDPEAAIAGLMAQCRAYVHREVDEALEAEEQPAKYSTEPRFDLRICRPAGQAEVAVIVPQGTKAPGSSQYAAGFRLAAIRRYAREHFPEARHYDGSDPEQLTAGLALLAEYKAAEDAAEAERQERWRKEREAREAAYRAQQAQPGEPDPYDEGDDEDDDDE
jgi:hypothetical protein